MAPRGSNKYRSVVQETWLAKLFSGERSKSSGAAIHDAGDVRTEHLLIEAKTVGGPSVCKPLPVFIKQFEKIALEAWEEGRQPMLALRYYYPSSPLSHDGFVDVCVMLATDMAEREDGNQV